MLKESMHDQVLPTMDKIIAELSRMAVEFADVPMLSRTHGQVSSTARSHNPSLLPDP